ncbi:V-type ATP synthase subunit I [Candidatus Woesearchaeota archaeon]|nr:V-type ATP synthase subunit I [Candidatus Woesearchaeota archaeon]
MAKLRIICPKSHLKRIIDELHCSRAVDIIEHSKEDSLDIGTPFSESSELSEVTIKARSLISQLNIITEKKIAAESLDKKTIKDTIKNINGLYEKVSEINSCLKDAETELKSLNESMVRLKKIKSLGLPLELYREYNSLAYFIGHVSDIQGLKLDIKKEFNSNYSIRCAQDDNKALVSVFIDKRKEMQMIKLLQKYNYSEITIAKEHTGSDFKIIDSIAKDIVALKKRISALAGELARLKKENEQSLPRKERALSIMIKKAEAPLMFLETKNISIISGWVPEDAKERLEERLGQITNESIITEELEIKETDSVPVKLDNPLPVRPYEFLLHMFSLPSYKELDPSLFMFITFPLFFGFMLGDIGYGIVTMMLFFFLKRLMPEGKDLLNIMIFSSISSIIFGFVFGEFFGFEIVEFHAIEQIVHESHIHYPFIHRNAESVLDLIMMTIGIGVVHVNFGLIMGYINVCRNKGHKHAILEKGSWFIIQLGVLLVGLSMAGFSLFILNGLRIAGQPLQMCIGFAVIAAGGVMIFLGEGVQGVVELPSVFVHMGSYMRLMAIGFASVGLAAVINEQTGPLMKGGTVGIICGITIFTVGHIINIALGVIGPFLHSLRLHYVEYFTKFYKGGGKEFLPFGAKD